jgi:hypothetical protein
MPEANGPLRQQRGRPLAARPVARPGPRPGVQRAAPPGGNHVGDAGDRLPQRHHEMPMRLASQGELRVACPSCRTERVQAMGFELKSGETAQMRRCTRCEWKSWWLGEQQVSLAQLLAVVQETGLPRASRKRSPG